MGVGLLLGALNNMEPSWTGRPPGLYGTLGVPRRENSAPRNRPTPNRPHPTLPLASFPHSRHRHAPMLPARRAAQSRFHGGSTMKAIDTLVPGFEKALESIPG